MKFIKDSNVRGIMILIALCGMFFIAAHSNAQQYERKGNKFIQVVNSGVRDTMITEYTIVDGKGNEKPVIINKANGRCYTWRISKNGRGYRAYLKAELSKTIAKELGVEYKESKK